MLSLLATAFAGYSQDSIRIVGNVVTDLEGDNLVYIHGNEPGKMDSVRIADGRFEFVLPYAEDMTLMLFSEYTSKRKGFKNLILPIDQPGTLYLDSIYLDKDPLLMLPTQVRGIPATALFYDYYYRKLGAAEQEARDKLLPTYSNDARNPAYREAIKPILRDIGKAHLKRFISEEPNSLAALTALTFAIMGGNVDILDLEPYYNELSDSNRRREQAKGLYAYYVTQKTAQQNTALGSVVPDFVLPNRDGKDVSLLSLRGKYVMIDFWASWCGPCIASFPHMKTVYEKYKDKGFEIYGVSVDAKKDQWLKADQEQHLPWVSVLDKEEGKLADYFGIVAIPTAVLLDPEGRVVLKESGFKTDGTGEMEKKLSELLP